MAGADRRTIAVICGEEEISYGRLFEMVDAAARRFETLRASRIGLRCPNGVQHIVQALAIVRAGKCLVPIADELCAREQEEVIRRTVTGAIVEADGAVREVVREGRGQGRIFRSGHRRRGY